MVAGDEVGGVGHDGAACPANMANTAAYGRGRTGGWRGGEKRVPVGSLRQVAIQRSPRAVVRGGRDESTDSVRVVAFDHGCVAAEQRT